MPARKPDGDVLQRAAQVLQEQSGNSDNAAAILGYAPSTVRRWKQMGWLDNPHPTVQAEREVRDAEFWRRKFNEAERARSRAEHLAEQLAGVRDVELHIPGWLMTTGKGNAGQSVIGCLISDVHMGEKIDTEEILGINAFDVDICQRRLRRYFDAVCQIGPRWISDTECQGVLLALAGDMISGDIHPELSQTNELTSHEQVQAVVEAVAAGIRMLVSRYGKVHVVGVPGNHGRTTHKPTAKLYASLSYDIMICSILQRVFAEDTAVTWQYGKSTDQIVPVFGRTILVTHGDKIGTRGGQGFAGPNLPIVRGTQKVVAQQAAVSRRPDLILMGHYHTSTHPGMVLANGSIPGYSEFASDIRAVVEQPQQWMFLLHSKWWLRERMPIQLEDPATPKRPTVRVPWRSS